eukprot:scaffold184_cov179-Amphora_coffeaeformis.AAC.8
MLHIALRKSRSDEHGLVLFMKELDACVEMATPTQSLVLAMDGPPGAAKLSTQRQRRRSVIVRSANKIKRLERMIGQGRRKVKQSVLKRRREKASADVRTLSITPGTLFMEKAAQATLYWAWQRMANPRSPLSRIHVFLSPSTVPGEGEVKLLEWIYTKKRKGDSIAILGGDSDLVLESLIIPPTISHDIFVLLPDGPRKYLAVSLWETTRALQQDYIRHMTMANVMKIRTDLVVLFILNGNDYLPKLRGAAGFSKIFGAYNKIQNQWNALGRADDAYLVDPDSLTWNYEFCIDFFSYLNKTSPMIQFIDDNIDPSHSFSPLSKLKNLADSGLLPKPIDFSVVNEGDEEVVSDVKVEDVENLSAESELYEEEGDEEQEEFDDNEIDDDKEEEDFEDEDDDGNSEQRLLRLSLGVAGTEDSYTYELWWQNDQRLRAGYHQLADIAISDLLGVDSPDKDTEADGDDDISVPVQYDWEIRVAAETNVESYLYGILWNLQSYQDGICSDYAYNYGKRKSPTAEDIVSFLQKSKDANLTLGPKTLAQNGFTPPINAGLSCLAALPSSVRQLIPKPYSLIPEEDVEEIYAKCIDPDDNGFDIILFKDLCEERLRALGFADIESDFLAKTSQYTSKNSWTVISRSHKPLSHPFDPPPPFEERFAKLRRDRTIRISQYPTIVEPRHREERTHYDARMQKARSGTPTRLPRIIHSSPGKDFLKLSIDKVWHRSVYANASKTKKVIKDEPNGEKSNVTEVTEAYISNGDEFEANRWAFNKGAPSQSPERTKDGVTALACLKQLEDAKILGNIEWHTTYPSDSEYASSDPEAHEMISLHIHPASEVHAFFPDGFKIGQDRETSRVSKKQIQHHLASITLESLLKKYTSKRWQAYSFNDIKSMLTVRATDVE